MDVYIKLHHVRKSILKTLTLQRAGRFRDMRPPKVDSNLYNYHLKQLVKDGYISKTGEQYTLSPKGLRFVDQISLENFVPRQQPKLLTKLFLSDENSHFLLWPKYKQPFIGEWSFPSGKVHYGESMDEAAVRELGYLTTANYPLSLVAVLEIRVFTADELTSHTIEHIYATQVRKSDISHEFVRWFHQADMELLELSPGTSDVYDLCSFDKPPRYQSVVIRRSQTDFL